MAHFIQNAPRERVLRTLSYLGFEQVREGEHISLRRVNPDGTITALTLPNRDPIRCSTLRAVFLWACPECEYDESTESQMCYQQGYDQLRAGDAAGARALLARSWACEPHFKTGELLGRCCTLTGDHAEALRWFAEGLKLNPRWQTLYRYRAELHEAMGNLAAALADYEAAVAIQRDYRMCREAAERIRKRLEGD